MSTSKRKWPGAGTLSILILVLIAAVVIAVRLCARREPRPGDRAGGKDDEHAKMCAKRHPLFPRLKVKQGGVTGDEPRSAGLPPAQNYAPRGEAANDSRAPTALRVEAAKATSGSAPAGPQALLAPGSTSDADPVATLTGDCPLSGCGLNGTWLGAGVPFRTLHLSPYRHNDINLSILEFLGPAARDGRREPLTLQIDGDVMHPVGRRIVEPGSVLRLGPPETPGGPPTDATYELTITNVREDQFWIAKDCPTGSTDPRCQPETFPIYDFSARSLKDDCPLEVCEPGLDVGSDATHNLIGTAVIFEGDYYDDAYTVRIAPPSTYDGDAFNIACLGTTISKMHRFRHTSAAKITAIDPPAPPVDQRQALLRLLTADYCAAGHPFTHDGVPLRIELNSPAVFDAPDYGPTSGPKGSGFALSTSPGATVDALWNADGAMCIGQPRLQTATTDLWQKIQEICRLVNHPVNHCVPGAGPVPATLPLPAESYALSQNPGP